MAGGMGMGGGMGGPGMGGMGGGPGMGGPGGAQAGRGPAGAGSVRRDDPAGGAALRENAADHGLFSPDKPDRGPEYGYDRFRLHKSEEVSIYTQDADKRLGMDPRAKACLVFAALLVVAFAVALVMPDVLFNGQHVTFTLARWVDDLTTNVAGLAALVSGQAFTSKMQFKVCQFALAALAGAGLAVCGAMFQGALKNAMASPSTLGVMTGAQLGSVLYILLGGSTVAFGGVIQMSDLAASYGRMNLVQYILATEGQALCALAGSLAVVGLVLLIAHIAGHGKVSKSALIIAGSVFSTAISAVIQLVRYYLTVEGDALQVDAVSSIATGTLASTSRPLDVVLVAVPVGICLLVLLRLRTRMNLLSFSDDEARSMGLSPQASRNLTILVCTLMTAVITAFCGGIGMLGFLVPLVVRKVVGADFKYLVPASMLMGAVFAVVANMFTNMLLSGMGMGSVTGIVGAVVFLVTVIRQRGQRNVDWA